MRLLTHKWKCLLSRCTSLINVKLASRHISSSANLSYTSRTPETSKKKETRKASVLIPICFVNRELSLLFMVRPMTIPQHRGEVCFPGFKEDDDGSDVIHTALRKAHEEIGLQQDGIKILGMMSTVQSRQDESLNVLPVIGYFGEIDLNSLYLNKDEVASIFTRSINSLCTNVHSTQFRRDIKSVERYTLPVYTGSQHRIWGLTALLVHELLVRLCPAQLYQFELEHR